MLMVNVDLPVNSVPELLAYAKANPDKMTFASAGPGVPHHLFMEVFKSMTGMKASHVPYRGSLPALNDLVAGHIPMMFSDLGPATGLLEGQARAAARHLDQDAASGVPGHSAARRGRRAGLRGGVVAGDRRAGADAAADPRQAQSPRSPPCWRCRRRRSRSLKYGFLPPRTAASMSCKDFVKSEIARWGKVVQDAGIAGSQ